MSMSYSFAAGPRAVAPQRKYRDALEEEEVPKTLNIMFDRRVVRGNTYAAQVISSNAQEEAERLVREQKRLQRQRERSRRKQTDRSYVQTDDYLEELVDRVKECDMYTQTEEFLDRPPSPLFMPGKVGVDTSTQTIQGDLFDFDLEVQPLLEVLVGKSLEQGLLEVLEEEEIRNIQEHQQLFEQKRNSELAEVQRLEAESRRKYEEKERRVRQERVRVERETGLHKKIAARQLASKVYDEINRQVIEHLKKSGYFYDPVRKEVGDVFMPWLYANVSKQLKATALSRSLVDELIHLSISKERSVYNQKMHELAEMRRLAAEERAREERTNLEMSLEEQYLRETFKEIDRLEAERMAAEAEAERKRREEEGIEEEDEEEVEDEEEEEDDDE